MQENFSEITKIIDTVNSIFFTADRRNWESCLSLFIDEPEIDYSSFSGNPSAKMKASELINTWKNFLPGFDSTLHYITNHKVIMNGNNASCYSYLTALHVIKNAEGGESWTLYGTYYHELVKTESGWKISKMQLNFIHHEGNMNLPKLAAERMKA
ncbi:MAG: nuclear transport factor 2 family protein [Ignavibacteriae bacterium]|nr:MAG: nuclear transport factor 2 family protein [Ignavibacteriota bacterium]